MSNIADLIEDYILRRLAAEHNRKVELKRSDIADEISCAPSQISYVLSTRFTQDKGFVVESRRGLGGFIRIGRVSLQNLIYQDILEKIKQKENKITAYIVKDDLVEVTFRLGEMTENEREIIQKGCLINYYRDQNR